MSHPTPPPTIPQPYLPHNSQSRPHQGAQHPTPPPTNPQNLQGHSFQNISSNQSPFHSPPSFTSTPRRHYPASPYGNNYHAHIHTPVYTTTTWYHTAPKVSGVFALFCMLGVFAVITCGLCMPIPDPIFFGTTAALGFTAFVSLIVTLMCCNRCAAAAASNASNEI